MPGGASDDIYIGAELHMTQANTVCIVGTGASAGGLQPMIEFFSAMPDEPGIAFVVVQHTDSTSRSQLPEILPPQQNAH